MQGSSHKQKQNKTKNLMYLRNASQKEKKSGMHMEDEKLFFFFSFFKNAKLINIREDYTFPGSGMLGSTFQVTRLIRVSGKRELISLRSFHSGYKEA